MLRRLREPVDGSSALWSRPPPQVLEMARSGEGRAAELGFLTESLLELEGEAGRPLRVLDVGCGASPLCSWLSHRGHQVSGIDLDVSLLRYLARVDVNGLQGSAVAYSAGRVEQLPYTRASTSSRWRRSCSSCRPATIGWHSGRPPVSCGQPDTWC
jgi:SAM-dependent methyltransferase